MYLCRVSELEGENPTKTVGISDHLGHLAVVVSVGAQCERTLLIVNPLNILIFNSF